MRRVAFLPLLLLACGSPAQPTAVPRVPVSLSLTASARTVPEGVYVTFCATFSDGQPVVATSWDLAADGRTDAFLPGPCLTTRFYFSGPVSLRVQARSQTGQVYQATTAILVTPSQR